MKRKISNMQVRLYLLGAIVLFAGLSGAVLIYRGAAGDSVQATGYEIVDGIAYPTTPENSKMYVHDMEVFGGKSAVLADEFRRWFVALWQGRSLAATVACCSVIISLGLCIAASRLPGARSGGRDNNGRTGTDPEI
jgi:hypothetical protein